MQQQYARHGRVFSSKAKEWKWKMGKARQRKASQQQTGCLRENCAAPNTHKTQVARKFEAQLQQQRASVRFSSTVFPAKSKQGKAKRNETKTQIKSRIK